MEAETIPPLSLTLSSFAASIHFAGRNPAESSHSLSPHSLLEQCRIHSDIKPLGIGICQLLKSSQLALRFNDFFKRLALSLSLLERGETLFVGGRWSHTYRADSRAPSVKTSGRKWRGSDDKSAAPEAAAEEAGEEAMTLFFFRPLPEGFFLHGR